MDEHGAVKNSSVKHPGKADLRFPYRSSLQFQKLDSAAGLRTGIAFYGR